MKNDTKISFGLILWLPAFVLGAIVGLIAFGFVGGFDIYKQMNTWFDNSEALKADNGEAR